MPCGGRAVITQFGCLTTFYSARSKRLELIAYPLMSLSWHHLHQDHKVVAQNAVYVKTRPQHTTVDYCFKGNPFGLLPYLNYIPDRDELKDLTGLRFGGKANSNFFFCFNFQSGQKKLLFNSGYYRHRQYGVEQKPCRVGGIRSNLVQSMYPHTA